MTSNQDQQRSALVEKLRFLKDQVARTVTEGFFRRHPDWLERFGEKGWKHGVEDAGFHLEFLAGAIAAGSYEPFKDYVRWTFQMLMARGIDFRFVVENLEQIRDALREHLEPIDYGVVGEFIAAACQVNPGLDDISPNEEGSDLNLAARLFSQALLGGQRKPALNIVLEAVRKGHAMQDIYVEVIQKALYEVGRLWQFNQIIVAEEHVATAVAQFVLARLYHHLPQPLTHRGKAIITGLEGELHQVGAYMVADMLECEGWDVRFLGTNLPSTSIVQATQEHEADLVGISATMASNLPRVRQLIDDLRRNHRGSDLPILVGGRAFFSSPGLAANVGADGFGPDLRAAVDMARKMGPN